MLSRKDADFLSLLRMNYKESFPNWTYVFPDNKLLFLKLPLEYGIIKTSEVFIS